MVVLLIKILANWVGERERMGVREVLFGICYTGVVFLYVFLFSVLTQAVMNHIFNIGVNFWGGFVTYLFCSSMLYILCRYWDNIKKWLTRKKK